MSDRKFIPFGPTLRSMVPHTGSRLVRVPRKALHAKIYQRFESSAYHPSHHESLHCLPSLESEQVKMTAARAERKRAMEAASELAGSRNTEFRGGEDMKVNLPGGRTLGPDGAKEKLPSIVVRIGSRSCLL